MAAKALVETQQRAAQQLHRRAIFLLAAFVLAVLLAGVALYQGKLVRQSAVTAQTNSKIAFSRELSAAALSNLDLDPERSILLGLQAADITRNLNGTFLSETEEALHRALVTSRVRLTLTGQSQGVLSTSYNPNGKQVAGIGFDGKTLIWDAETGRKLLEIPGNTQVKDAKGVQRIAYSPDGSRLATGDDHFVKVWDVRLGSLVQSLNGHTNDVWAVAYSPDGGRIASSGVDGTVRLWNSSSGASEQDFKGFHAPVEMVAFSPDGKRIAASSDDPALMIWDIQSGVVLVNRTDLPDIVAVNFSLDGKKFAVGSSAGIEALDASTFSGTSLLSIQDSATWVSFSPDGSRLATANGSVVRLWDAETGRELFTLKGHGGWVNDLTFSPDGTKLASASMDETVKIWSLEPGQEIASMTGSGIRVAYSPDGKWLAQEAAGGAIQLWDAKTGSKRLTIGGNGTVILGFAFSLDGKRLAAGGTDKSVRVWDTATGDLLLTMKGHELGVRDVAYSRDGKRIASASFDQTARVWDAASGKELF